MVRLFANITAGHIVALGFFSLIFIFGNMSIYGGYGISTDDSGNSVITGCFEKTITFGNISLTSGGNYPDAFISKYDASGNALWAKRAGGTYIVRGYDTAINDEGACIVTGVFYESVTFGSATFKTAGSKDIFTAKYAANGDLLWARQLGGSSSDELEPQKTIRFASRDG